MILCCGEALIDMLPRETADGERVFFPAPGGSVFNSAVALGRLGTRTAFFSGLSTDFFGERLREVLQASGVAMDHVKFSDRPTTLAFVSIADGQASYVFYDEGSAGRMLTATDLPSLGDEVRALLFGGISLIFEPCGSAYEALMTREADDRVVMLDPNIRAAFIPDRSGHLTRLERMIALADIVKVSEDDLAWFGEEGGADEIARRWLARGPSLVVVTLGSQGLVACTSDETLIVPAHSVDIADTVGAGDTFNAALLSALEDIGRLSKTSIATLAGAELRGALEFATSAASVTVSRAGASPPWRHELEARPATRA